MANEEHRGIFKLGANAWNKWREENPDIQPDLSTAFLSRVFPGAAFLIGTFLSRAFLGAAHLINAYLRWAHLWTSPRRTDIHWTSLHRTDIHWACLRGARFSGAHLIGARFRRTNLRWADLHGMFLYGVDFRRLDLTGANLSQADLRWADLRRAYLSGAILTGAILNWADLSGVDLRWAHLNGASLSGADLTEAYLIGADFSGANLSRAYLRGANLRGANLSRANLRGASLSRANLRGADLSGVDLNGVNLAGAIFSDAPTVEEQPDSTQRPDPPVPPPTSPLLDISVSNPTLLSKRFESKMLVRIYSPQKREEIKALITKSEAEKVFEGPLILGQEIVVRLQSPAMDITDPATLLLSQTITTARFLVKPKDSCEPGNRDILLSVSDKEGSCQYLSEYLSVKVADFAFDHIPRPILAHATSAVLGIGSFATFVLTSLGKLDTALGLPAGAATAVIATAVGITSFKIFLQSKNTATIQTP